MNVWNRVVEDLQNYSEEQKKQKKQKRIINRIMRFIIKNSCGGDCNQGRSPCNCEKRYEQDR